MVKQFDIFEDGVGVVRAKGRLQNANVPFETKAPIVLNKDHRLAYLLVMYCHHKVYHNGVKQTLNELRALYWFTRGRNFVKKILHDCVVCQWYNSRPYS